MDVENTDLDRRVLAHEQILQGEQDYTGTAAYAEQFIQQVVRLRDKAPRS